MKKRAKTGILYIAISVIFSIVLGALFALFPGKRNYLDSFLFWSKVFCFFGGGCIAAGLLCFLTNVNEDYVFGFGNGLYYGTLFTTKFLFWLLDSEKSEIIFIAFVITALISYIIWFKNYKDRE